MNTETIEQSTKQLIDALKRTCGAFGLGNDGNEYKIIIQVFLYKYMNDKFGYEAKRVDTELGRRLKNAKKWEAEYDKFSEDEAFELFDYLPPATPMLLPEHTISHIYNSQQKKDFATLFDSTMVDIANLNAEVFSTTTAENTRLTIFEEITPFVSDKSKRDEFAISLCRYIADDNTNFEPIFTQKYDFFSTMFEYLIKDYNKDGGGKYAEYYTPRSIALIMARLLVGNQDDLRSIECYDPSAGSGTLLMALAHTIGENRCSIYSQDISQKSSKMLRLNLILNNLVGSLPNIIEGDTLLNPYHKDKKGALKQFDFIISNPPFKLDFPDTRDTIAKDKLRFWAGVPNIPPTIDPDKPKMEIYTCFIQHMINSLKEKNGRGAIVVPTGFITAKSGIKKKILQRIVDKRIVYGCVIMPSNVFATTNTNVSVLFFDKSKSHDNVVLVDASQMGETYKDGNTKRTKLNDSEIEKIITTFLSGKPVDNFCACPTYEEIANKNYCLAAGQYYDVKIDYTPISADEYRTSVLGFNKQLKNIIERGAVLDKEILETLKRLK